MVKSVWILWRWHEIYGVFETEEKAKDFLEENYRAKTNFFSDFEIIKTEVQ